MPAPSSSWWAGTMVAMALFVAQRCEATLAPEPPERESAELAELAAVSANVVTAAVNFGLSADDRPNSLVGALGIATGLATTVWAMGDGVEHSTSLVMSGALSMVAGLVAVRWHRMLDRRAAESRIESSWIRDPSGGRAPAITLVVDF